MKARTISGVVLLWIVVLCAGVSGCDAVGEAAVQTGEAGLRTIVDLLLTDFTNQVAASLQNDLDDSDNGDDGDGDGNGNDNANDNGNDNSNGGGGDDPVTRGEAVFADNCAICHGADGASGFAPNIQGVTAAEISDKAAGGGGHAMYDISEQDASDIEAYLGSF